MRSGGTQHHILFYYQSKEMKIKNLIALVICYEKYTTKVYFTAAVACLNIFFFPYRLLYQFYDNTAPVEILLQRIFTSVRSTIKYTQIKWKHRVLSCDRVIKFYICILYCYFTFKKTIKAFLVKVNNVDCILDVINNYQIVCAVYSILCLEQVKYDFIMFNYRKSYGIFTQIF